jgi:hypothetical protein
LKQVSFTHSPLLVVLFVNRERERERERKIKDISEETQRYVQNDHFQNASRLAYHINTTTLSTHLLQMLLDDFLRHTDDMLHFSRGGVVWCGVLERAVRGTGIGVCGCGTVWYESAVCNICNYNRAWCCCTLQHLHL